MKPTLVLPRALMVTAAVSVLAFLNTAALRAHWNLDAIGTSRRYWEDMTVAFSLYETKDWGPAPSVSIDDAMASRIYRRLRQLVPPAAARSDLRPWEFWRTVEFRDFRNIAPFELRHSDDTGRSYLSFLGFRAVGGIAPYLPLWLPFLAFVPLVFWMMVEFLRAREGAAGAVFLVLASSSAYLLEALTLPYSAAGFHFLAALVIVPLALFAFGPPPTARGVWLRVGLTAIALHVAAWCRSSSMISMPAAALLLLIAIFRAEQRSSLKRRVALTAVLLCALVAPRALAPPQAHEFWVGMWEGLGDFDRQYGHGWSDPLARVTLDREGHTMETRGPYWTEETEAIFRRLVLKDVRADPVWYVKILLRRAVATVTQWRLRPTMRDSGLSYQPSQHEAEGVTDTYYNFVKTADVFTASGRTWEAPLSSFWVAAALFVALALRRRSPEWRRRVAVTLSFALSALLMPVAVTTASGMETQVFAFSFFLCAAFVGSEALNLLRRRKTV